MIGKTLSHFRIESRIGAGGMGEVYRARDTRLDRTVAVKILPAEFAADPLRRERLRREAQAISRLNHPHVCTLYDIGHEEDMEFLVLEHLEGPTLAERLRSGPLPLREALTIAAQIADGLDAAHRLGIVHRDLKPGNVMLTATGAKLLDFGLARDHGDSGEAGTMVATRTVGSGSDPITAEGTVLGTLHYMSPEQLHGETADTRSDIFSFGALLYEMVAGRAPFDGRSQASVIAAILEKEPEPITRPDAPISPMLERLIARCLRKDPEERWQSARDLMHELRWIAGEGTTGTSVPVDAASASPPARRPGLGILAGVVAVTGIAAGILLGPRLLPSRDAIDAGAPAPMVRASIPLPEGERLAGWGSPTVAISDDGSTIAFVTSDRDWRQRLYVRPLRALESTLVPESDHAEGPVFSPDGKWIVFAVATSGGARGAAPELKLYSLESGLTQTLTGVRDYFGAAWRPDGTILWCDQIPRGLWRIDPDGGEAENFLPEFRLQGEEARLALAWPEMLPDGERTLICRFEAGWNSNLGLLDLRSGEIADLGTTATGVELLGDGRLAWVDFKGTLMVAPFDADTGTLAGKGRAVDTGISIGGANRSVFAVSGNGTAVLARGAILGSGRSPRRLVRIGEDGVRMVPPVEPAPFRSFALSPDGTRVALISFEGIQIQDLNREGRTDLATGSIEPLPNTILWSPDGDRLAFVGLEPGTTSLDVYTVSLDGGEPPTRVFDAESEASPAEWEPGGKAILVRDFPLEDGERIRVLRVPLDGAAPVEIPLADAGAFAISPDGTHIAYLQSQGDARTLFVRTYPDLGPRTVVASGNYSAALWSPDGGTLFAFSAERAEAFSIERSPSLRVKDHRIALRDLADVHVPRVNPGLLGGFYVLEDVPGAGIVTSLEVVTNWVQHLP